MLLMNMPGHNAIDVVRFVIELCNKKPPSSVRGIPYNGALTFFLHLFQNRQHGQEIKSIFFIIVIISFSYAYFCTAISSNAKQLDLAFSEVTSTAGAGQVNEATKISGDPANRGGHAAAIGQLGFLHLTWQIPTLALDRLVVKPDNGPDFFLHSGKPADQPRAVLTWSFGGEKGKTTALAPDRQSAVQLNEIGGLGIFRETGLRSLAAKAAAIFPIMAQTIRHGLGPRRGFFGLLRQPPDQLPDHQDGQRQDQEKYHSNRQENQSIMQQMLSIIF